MQNAAVEGDRNIVVQIVGTNNNIRITSAEVSLSLARRHARPAAVRKDLDLLSPFAQAIPLRGREADLVSLLVH